MTTRGTRQAKRVATVAATSQSRRGGCRAAHLRLGSVGGQGHGGTCRPTVRHQEKLVGVEKETCGMIKKLIKVEKKQVRMEAKSFI